MNYSIQLTKRMLKPGIEFYHKDNAVLEVIFSSLYGVTGDNIMVGTQNYKISDMLVHPRSYPIVKPGMWIIGRLDQKLNVQRVDSAGVWVNSRDHFCISMYEAICYALENGYGYG